MWRKILVIVAALGSTSAFAEDSGAVGQLRVTGHVIGACRTPSETAAPQQPSCTGPSDITSSTSELTEGSARTTVIRHTVSPAI